MTSTRWRRGYAFVELQHFVAPRDGDFQRVDDG